MQILRISFKISVVFLLSERHKAIISNYAASCRLFLSFWNVCKLSEEHQNVSVTFDYSIRQEIVSENGIIRQIDVNEKRIWIKRIWNWHFADGINILWSHFDPYQCSLEAYQHILIQWKKNFIRKCAHQKEITTRSKRTANIQNEAIAFDIDTDHAWYFNVNETHNHNKLHISYERTLNIALSLSAHCINNPYCNIHFHILEIYRAYKHTHTRTHRRMIAIYYCCKCWWSLSFCYHNSCLETLIMIILY